tara:strand:+ start:28680 stop:29162 length:483 start_codon:yes stop_codon:yes gene_type:complete
VQQKIKSRDEIKKIVNILREQNKKIVTTNGSFDILHVGHIQSLVDAKKQGDVLIVGLNSDSSIKQYKSLNRPINPEQNRALMLAALACVDYVSIFSELNPNALLRIIKPDFHIKSKSGFTGVEKEAVEESGGKIILQEDIPGLSTSNIIKKILEAYSRKE